MIKTLKDLFIISLLGLALVGCEESAPEITWSTIVDKDVSKATMVNGDTHDIVDTGAVISTDYGDLIGIGVSREIIMDGNNVVVHEDEFDKIQIALQDNYLMKAVKSGSIDVSEGNGFDYVTDGTKIVLSIDVKKIIANNQDSSITVGINSPVIVLEIYEPEDIEKTKPILKYAVIL